MTATRFCVRIPGPVSTFVGAAALVVIGLVSATPASAQRFETRAATAILVDADTDTVLFQKDADARLPPASMAKLMTSAVVFDAVKIGRLKLDDEFQVSERAWREGGAKSGGSTMFAKLGSTIRIEDLIRGIVVQSGNDACIVVAEGMAGTEATFADILNAEARKIGLTGSHFTNATGLPDPDQYMTARDLARLAEYIITEFPEFYKIYGETEFTWNKIRQRNRNPLLEMNIGADGLKTGHTEEAGYGLVGSAVRDGQRLIMVISGMKSEKERAEEARKLLDWGFRAFERVTLFSNNEVIGEASVFGGDQPRVGVVSRGSLDLLLPVGSRDLIKAQIVYDGPIQAPIEEGQEVGVIRITTSEGMTKEAPVYAATDIGVGTLRQRAVDGLEELLLGWW
ncbi:MAG: D-alanyl-D-alanine carboxypeptidase [Bauldia sp.]|nr:MAG: D-alanyl-D-alanine carboxypeptidase [Bauldia sp.]